MTKLYFHNATSSVTGTLPSTIQSTTLGACGSGCIAVDAATVNRSMDTTIGTSQTSKSAGFAAPTTKTYMTRFCSLSLNQTSISANTWNYAFAAQRSSASCHFPCSGTTSVSVTCYIWRPSTGAKIATILDGSSSTNFTEPSTTATEKSVFGTFSGGAVSFATGDIVCFEIYFGNCGGASSTNLFYYDGTTETNNNGTTVSSHASYIETPQTLAFQGGVLNTINIVPSFCYV